jgi:hypothetical protein
LKVWILVGLEGISKEFCVTGTFTLTRSNTGYPVLSRIW